MVVNKTNYLDKIENILNDTRKFKKKNLKNDGILSFVVKQEKRVRNIKKLDVSIIAHLKKQDVLKQLG